MFAIGELPRAKVGTIFQFCKQNQKKFSINFFIIVDNGQNHTNPRNPGNRNESHHTRASPAGQPTPGLQAPANVRNSRTNYEHHPVDISPDTPNHQHKGSPGKHHQPRTTDRSAQWPLSLGETPSFFWGYYVPLFFLEEVVSLSWYRTLK